MADETKGEQQMQGQELRQKAAELLGKDKIEGLTEDEIRARLVSTDSGDTLDHEDVAEGLANELSAQTRVIDLLSEQREPAGTNIAKVLEADDVDVAALMAIQIKEPTKQIIGPLAEKSRRKSIQNEINLPNAVAFKMCMKSVIIRLGRVAITASGIFLGIAFFASVRMTNLILQADAVNTGAGAIEMSDQARQVWLIVMALMVSVVGITNSMLMAVAERFQEIGTMKCLGALDQFIVKLFLIESGLLGLLAGLTGSLLGMGLIYLTKLNKYVYGIGDVWLGMLILVIQAVLLGTVLSIIAAILPAKQAAKMPAAAALRTAV